jgi:CRP-like cAMP-binding protein
MRPSWLDTLSQLLNYPDGNMIELGRRASSSACCDALAQDGEAALETMVRSSNGFLSALSADDYELIRPHLRTGDLPHDAVLVETGETLKRAYFPHRGVISLVVELTKGEHVQVAMIGRDSLLGTLSIMDDACALNTAFVLVPGSASVMDLDRLRVAADQSRTLRSLLARHGLAVYAQVQQTAGCNAAHPVESRLSRCLLHTHDLSGDFRLLLTQEAMAQMIGARRNSVSLVANSLQQANFIHYSRGHIQILNLDGLRQTACECYATVKAQYDRLLRPR